MSWRFEDLNAVLEFDASDDLGQLVFALHPAADFETRRPRHRDGLARPPRLRRRLPGRYFDPLRRGSADAHRAIINGAAIAPDNPSRKSPAPTPETNNQRRNRRSESSRAHQDSVAVHSRSGFVLNKGG